VLTTRTVDIVSPSPAPEINSRRLEQPYEC